MPLLDLPDLRLHWRADGDPEGRPVVFANSLGTDLTLWDAVLPLLPEGRLPAGDPPARQMLASLVEAADGSETADLTAVTAVIDAVLFAPSFLYRTELGDDAGREVRAVVGGATARDHRERVVDEVADDRRRPRGRRHHHARAPTNAEAEA